jgi:hypothetical protein
MKMSHDTASNSSDDGTNPMDKLLAKLSEQQDALTKQRDLLKSSEENTIYNRTVEYVSGTSNSALITPTSDIFNVSTAPTTAAPNLAEDDATQLSADEVLRLKRELEAAKGKIARMDQELAQTRITKHTVDRVIGTPSELDFPVSQQAEISDNCLSNVQHGLKSTIRQTHRDLSWAGQDDSRSDTSDTLSASGFNRTRDIWGNSPKPAFPGAQNSATNFQPSEALTASQWMGPGFSQPFIDTPIQYTGTSVNAFRGDRIMPGPELLMTQPTTRRNNLAGRLANRTVGSFSYAGSNGSYDGYAPVSALYGAANGLGGGVNTSIGLGVSAGISGNMPGGTYSGYQPQPIGTPLSPHAPEFTSSTGWKGDVSTILANWS